MDATAALTTTDSINKVSVTLAMELASAATNREVSSEIEIEIPPLIRRYKDGRIERLLGTDFVPPSLHDSTTCVASKDVVINQETSLSARLYLPPVVSDDTKRKKKLPVVVYYHGGGFCIESAFSPIYHSYLNSLAKSADALVVSVEYRLAPEHPIPAAYDDAWEALQWVASASGDEWLVDHVDLSRLFLAGDSAGANIVHNVAMRAGGDDGLSLKGVVLVHPYFWSKKRIGREAEGRGTFLTVAAVDATWPFVCPGVVSEGEEDPRLNPLVEEAPSLEKLGCERMLVCVAAKDLLADRGRAYCEGVKGSGWGGEMELLVSEDEDHVFHLFNPGCGKATEMMASFIAFINH